jgi:hypothetical protein
MGWDSNGEPLTPIACTCSGGDLQRVQLLSSHGADRGPVDPGWAPPEDDLEPPLSSAEQCSLLKACAPACAPDASCATALVLVCSRQGHAARDWAGTQLLPCY